MKDNQENNTNYQEQSFLIERRKNNPNDDDDDLQLDLAFVTRDFLAESHLLWRKQSPRPSQLPTSQPGITVQEFYTPLPTQLSSKPSTSYLINDDSQDVSLTCRGRPVDPSEPTFDLSPSKPLLYSHDPPPSISKTPNLPYTKPRSNNERQEEAWTSRAKRPRRTPCIGKSETIPAPFPWATTRRAIVHPLEYLLSFQIGIISGNVECRKCDKNYVIGYDLMQKFPQVGSYIMQNKNTRHNRAPSVWMNPVLPTCNHCHQENSLKPVMPPKKRNINWLFLWLGQMLGCCTLDQLKYFCKHTKNHRTSTKDRLVYSTYLCLCKQLDPNAPFDLNSELDR